MRFQTIIEIFAFNRLCRIAFKPAVPVLIPIMFSEKLRKAQKHGDWSVKRIHHEQDVPLSQTVSQNQFRSFRTEIREFRCHRLRRLDQTEKTFPVIYLSLWPYSTTYMFDVYINPTGRLECLVYMGGGSHTLKYNL